MKANDLGLSVYQMRLLTCAQIVRKGEYEDERGLSMHSFQRCAISEYCRALPDAITWPCPTGMGLGAVICKHFNLRGMEWTHLFGTSLAPVRTEIADRIEHFALHEHADAKVMV